MKITTVKEVVEKNGTKTVITIEEEMINPAISQFSDHLEAVGFYNRTITQKFFRFISGKRGI